MNARLFIAFIVGFLIIPVLSLSPEAFAQSEIQKLQSQIQDRGNRLAEIEAEIAKFESDLQQVGSEKKTLQSAINQLELERKKVTAEISKTENQISSTDLEINKLILEISRTEKDISETEDAIAQVIRAQYKSEEETLVELLLRHNKLSEFWSTFEAHESVRNTMSAKVTELSSFQALLEESRDENEEKRSRLTSLKDKYRDQNSVLTNNKEGRANVPATSSFETRSSRQNS